MFSIWLLLMFECWLGFGAIFISPHSYTIDDINNFETNINSLRTLIGDKMDNSFSGRNKKNVGIFIRTLFHDCSNCYITARDGAIKGCCDGCVDYNNEFNAGLKERGFEGYGNKNKIVKQGLKIWYDEWIANDINNNGRSSWTRADFIASCANIAIEYAIGRVGGIEYFNSLSPLPINSIPLTYPIYFFGRKDCITTNYWAHPANAMNPQLNLKFVDPVTDLWQDNILDFFETQFGFNNFESVAIISGGHNIGTAHDIKSFDSGFPDSWKYRLAEFDKGYPDGLERESWDQCNDENNNGLYHYRQHKNHKRMMLNVDISMIYNITPYIDTNTGILDQNNGCIIQGSIELTNKKGEIPPRTQPKSCPYLINYDGTKNIDQINSYFKNKPKNNPINGHFRFLTDFLNVWQKLITNGYDINQMYQIQATDKIPLPTPFPTKSPQTP